MVISHSNHLISIGPVSKNSSSSSNGSSNSMTSLILYGDPFSAATRLVTCTMEMLGLR